MSVDEVTAARVQETLKMKANEPGALAPTAADARVVPHSEPAWSPSRMLKRGAIKAAGGSGNFTDISLTALPKVPKDEATRRMLAVAFAESVLFSVRAQPQ